MKPNFYVLYPSQDKQITGLPEGEAQCEIRRKDFTNKKYFDAFISALVVLTGRSTSELEQYLSNFPEVEIVLESAMLEKRAKATDFMSYFPTAQGTKFLLSKKATEVLSDLKIPPYHLYDIKVQKRSTRNVFDYKLLLSPNLALEEYVHFEESEFCVKDKFRNSKTIEIKSSQHFFDLKDKDRSLMCRKLVLQGELENQYDYFNILLSNHVIVSNNFKSKIEESGLSGIEFLTPGKPYGPEILFKP